MLVLSLSYARAILIVCVYHRSTPHRARVHTHGSTAALPVPHTVIFPAAPSTAPAPDPLV
jgi:hypothetical protein